MTNVHLFKASPHWQPDVLKKPQHFPKIIWWNSIWSWLDQIRQINCYCVCFSAGPPRVSDKVVHRQSARLGSAIKLPCPVDGDPPPLIMWTKDGRNIHSGWIRFRILRSGLKIKEVEADDTGTYICKATNGFGSVNINYTLIVIGECLIWLLTVVKLLHIISESTKIVKLPAVNSKTLFQVVRADWFTPTTSSKCFFHGYVCKICLQSQIPP